MTRTYCTYFDCHYLYHGLTLYRSLSEHAGDFKLWILCFDEESLRILDQLRLPQVELIPLHEFENPDLLAVKSSRTPVEYYWTSTPDLPLYIFRRDPGCEQVTYLDADLFFFGPPEPIEQEFEGASIQIVEHRYSLELRHLSAESGIYNVSWLTFRRDANALACLAWWRERCLEWCYARVEDGKMGDQKYLDDWPQRFAGITVLQNIGGGVAPWNIQNYHFQQRAGQIQVDEMPLIFYHFHQFKPLGPHLFDLAQRYRLNQQQINLIYRPYIAAIQQTIAQVQHVAPGFQDGYFGRDAFTEFKRIIKRHWHIVRA